jgi:ribonuclease BN (tRNA processing enzyme)
MRMQLTLLGSGGWVPTERRETCCALIRTGSTAILIDAGTGVSRLLERPDLLDGVDRLEIVLTHFHLDHVVGLAYLPGLAADKRVWAPGRWLYGAASEAILRRLLDPPLFAADLADFVTEVAEIPDGGLALGSVELRARVQELHPQPTLALRSGNDFAYCTDTALDDENVEFASGVRTLYHEAWHAAAHTDDRTHTAAGEAGRLAREAAVGELVLIHVNPLLGDDELLAPAVEEFEPAVVGEDWLER